MYCIVLNFLETKFLQNRLLASFHGNIFHGLKIPASQAYCSHCLHMQFLLAMLHVCFNVNCCHMLTFEKNVREVATIVLVPKHSVLRPWYMSAMCTSADWNVAVGE